MGVCIACYRVVDLLSGKLILSTCTAEQRIVQIDDELMTRRMVFRRRRETVWLAGCGGRKALDGFCERPAMRESQPLSRGTASTCHRSSRSFLGRRLSRLCESCTV